MDQECERGGDGADRQEGGGWKKAKIRLVAPVVVGFESPAKAPVGGREVGARVVLVQKMRYTPKGHVNKSETITSRGYLSFSRDCCCALRKNLSFLLIRFLAFFFSSHFKLHIRCSFSFALSVPTELCCSYSRRRLAAV